MALNGVGNVPRLGGQGGDGGRVAPDPHQRIAAAQADTRVLLERGQISCSDRGVSHDSAESLGDCDARGSAKSSSMTRVRVGHW
jgi:hypothetical protein